MNESDRYEPDPRYRGSLSTVRGRLAYAVYWVLARTRRYMIHIGAVGEVAYLAEPMKALFPLWVAVALVIAPYIAADFAGAFSGRQRSRWILYLAAAWYTCLAGACFWYALQGHRPPAWQHFLVVVTLGLIGFASCLTDRHVETAEPGAERAL